MKPHRISIVSYTNTLPFKYGITESGLLNNKVALEYDIPSVCAQKLIDGKVDIGLVPVAILPQLSSYHMVSRYCLGCNGEVDTVKLYSEVPLEEIGEVLLDYQSRSSVSLVQVLSRLFWKIAPTFVQAEEGFEKKINGKTAAVVIGDRCFDMNGRFACEHDLAGEWKKYTGLPFVFAAWVSNKKLDDEFVQGFERALEFGLDHIGEAVRKHVSADRQELVLTYLTERINYRFDADKRRSMEHFLSLLSQLP